MRRFGVIILLFIASFSMFAFTKKEPKWFSNKESVYPEKKYICMVGAALDEEGSRNAALAEISRYISVSVNATMNAEFGEVNSGKKSQLYQNINENITSSTSMTMSGIQYSECYYSKKQKTYYTAAYIDRSKAWAQYANEADMNRAEFYSYYNAAEGKDPLSQYVWYSEAQRRGTKFTESLLMLSILDNTRTNSVYGQDKMAVASINKKKTECLKKSTVFIISNDPEAGRSVSQVLANQGYVVTQSKNNMYLAEIQADLNIEVEKNGSDSLYVASPALTMRIKYGEEVIYNFFGKVQDKVVTRTENGIQKKARAKLDELIQKDLKEYLK